MDQDGWIMIDPLWPLLVTEASMNSPRCPLMRWTSRHRAVPCRVPLSKTRPGAYRCKPKRWTEQALQSCSHLAEVHAIICYNMLVILVIFAIIYWQIYHLLYHFPVILVRLKANGMLKMLP